MTLKNAIKQAINDHSKKYTASKVWEIEVDEYGDGSYVMWVEISVKKRKKIKINKSSIPIDRVRNKPII